MASTSKKDPREDIDVFERFLERSAREQEYLKIREIQEERKRQRTKAGFMLASVAMLTLSIIYLFFGGELFVSVEIVLVMVSAILFLALATGYLTGGRNLAASITFDPKEVETRAYVEQRFRDLESRLKETSSKKGVEISNEERAEILNSIRARLESEQFRDYAAAITNHITAQVKSESIERRLFETRGRLLEEVASLSKRATLNLLLGIAITIIGISILGVAVFGQQESGDWLVMAYHFVPRLALAVVIEVFAYFFLSLYRSGLSEIKYFQNEITNIESKHLALTVAIAQGHAVAIEKIACSIVDTDRNGSATDWVGQKEYNPGEIAEVIRAIGSLRKSDK